MTRSLPRLALPHLTDEAVAAFADGALRGPARQRAGQHLAECLDCAGAVQGQRVASAVLRAAAAPILPLDLMDRLRRLPGYVPLSPSAAMPSGLSADGQPVFAAYGSAPGGPVGMTPTGMAPTGMAPTGMAPTGMAAAPAPSFPVTRSIPAPAAAASGPDPGHARRRFGSAAGLTTVAAAVTVGLLAATSASAGGAPTRAPVAPVRGGSTPATSPLGSSIVIGPALDLSGRR